MTYYFFTTMRQYQAWRGNKVDKGKDMTFNECSRSYLNWSHQDGKWVTQFIKRVYKACGSPPGVIVADTLSFNAKIGLVDF